MAKTLKEALLEKFADLQQLGIAPSTRPPMDDDGPSVRVEMGSGDYTDGGGRRQRSSRGTAAWDDDQRRGGDVPIKPRSRPRRPERGDRGRPGVGAPAERFRRNDRGERGDSPLEGPLPASDRPMRPPMAPRPGGPMGDRPPFAPRPGGPPGAPRPPFGNRPPMGDRPQFGNRPGGPGNFGPGNFGPGRPGGPGGPGGPPQAGVTDRLRERADQRRREEATRDELIQLVAKLNEAEPSGEALDEFFGKLSVETGALPPIERVLEAVKLANSTEAVKVGDAVRKLFRRPRPRPTPVPS